MNIFKTKERKLRSIWWVAVFFLVLAAMTLPVILIAQHYKYEISIGMQAIIVILVTWVCQVIRKESITNITGIINYTWLIQLLFGISVGTILMLVPALFLLGGGWVSWQFQSIDWMNLLSMTLLFISVAVAEELLFRGFIFQRLIESIGVTGAQLIIAGYFLLIHMNNPGMEGELKIFAAVNIFSASLLFGIAYLKNKSLAMPIGIHFMANWVQGALLGLGVSGNTEAGILQPDIIHAPTLLTGGSFGLEASIPGLIWLTIVLFIMRKWNFSFNN